MTGHDCGHICCDERSDPYHDHFLTPEQCCASGKPDDILTQIKTALAEVYTPEGCRIWMGAKQQQWGGLTVDEMLERGRGDEVLATIDRLASGSFG